MSLVVWLPLDGDLRNQGVSDLIFSAASSNTTTNANGKIGTCYTNNSHSAGGLISDKPILLGSQYSMCCWFKFTNLEASSNLGGGLISQHRYSKNTGFGLTIKYVSSTTGYLSVNTGTGSARTFNTYCGTTLLQATTWYHACGTYDGTNIKIYVNGILEKTQAYNMSAPEDYLTVFCWSLSGSSGATIHSDYKLNGAINDVRVYDHALSDAEVREIAQGLVLHYKLDDLENGVLDSSGYGHNGEIINTISTSDNTSRYDACVHISATNQKIKISNFPTSGFGNSYSFSWWAKISSASPMHWGFADGIRLNGMYTGRLWNTGDSSSNPLYKPGTTTQVDTPTANVWHHWVMTGDGTTCKVYQDGVHWGTAKTYKAISGQTIYINGWDSGTSYSSNDYSVSDFRIYCTALDADAVRQLYEVGAKIDNKANFHTFEISENNTNKLTKTGIMHDNMEESILTLPDGSCWQLLMFHYVDGGHNLFTSSKALNCDEFGLFSRLKDINNFTYDGKYEFYVIQDDIEYRWTQTNQPTASSISGLTTVSGYTNPVNGLAKASQSNSYFGYNAWWGAVGCYTSFSTGGKTGIPGFGSHDANGICTRYMALYARIEKADVKISNQTLNASEIIEL